MNPHRSTGFAISAIAASLLAPHVWATPLNDVPTNRASDKVNLPAGAAFVGLVGEEWRLFVVEASGQLHAVHTRTEPRTPAYAARLGRAAYVSSAGELLEIEIKSRAEQVLLTPSSKMAFTQPAYRPRTDELYVVALRDGTSIETDIVRVDRATKRTTTVLSQRSAQLEPAFSADGMHLFYSNVACASECQNIVQEIWGMDVVGGRVQQHTLLNAVSRQPVSAADGSVLFASNTRGTYQLWRSESIGVARRVTDEKAIVESPVATDTGEILFIRRTAAGGQIMAMTAGTSHPVALPVEISDVRDLRWGGY